MTTLTDRVVVVAGGATGLGRACVEEFAAQGASVVVGDIDLAGARAAVAKLGDRGRAVACDVSRSEDCKTLMDASIATFGRIDAVMSNAGIEGKGGSAETCEEPDWDRVLAVNLKGMFLIAKHAVPKLRANGGGTILMMSSIAAFWGEPGEVAYSAAKGGVIGLVKAMAMDHARDGIRVNCLCPGPHTSGMIDRFVAAQADPAGMASKMDDLIALRRMGRPEELARTAAFLLSDANPYMTGSAIVVDGGLTAGHPWHEQQP